MFLLVPAHPGFPGQTPQSRKTVVLCCVEGHTAKTPVVVEIDDMHSSVTDIHQFSFSFLWEARNRLCLTSDIVSWVKGKHPTSKTLHQLSPEDLWSSGKKNSRLMWKRSLDGVTVEEWKFFTLLALNQII